MLYSAIRPALFALDPERAHALTLRALRAAGYALTSSTPTTAIECLGLRFPNRVGLAAGFDKNAVAVDGLGTLGFGFIEIGTVTPRPQAGQSRPRLFRFPDSGPAKSTRLSERWGRSRRRATAASAIPGDRGHQHRQECRHSARPRRG
jgi:hypothetical protein